MQDRIRGMLGYTISSVLLSVRLSASILKKNGRLEMKPSSFWSRAVPATDTDLVRLHAANTGLLPVYQPGYEQRLD